MCWNGLAQSSRSVFWVVFGGSVFFNFFIRCSIYSENRFFFDFQNFQNCQLIIFRGLGALLRKKIFFFCFCHEPKTIWGIYRPLPVFLLEYSSFYSRFNLWRWDFPPPHLGWIRLMGGGKNIIIYFSEEKLNFIAHMHIFIVAIIIFNEMYSIK